MVFIIHEGVILSICGSLFRKMGIPRPYQAQSTANLRPARASEYRLLLANNTSTRLRFFASPR
jgi:hypothetical protein